MVEHFIPIFILTISTIVNIVVPYSGSAVITPILTFFSDPHTAIAFASFYFALSSLVRAYVFRKHRKVNEIKRILPLSLVGSLLGALALIQIPANILLLIILLFSFQFFYEKIKTLRNQKNTKEAHPLKVHTVSLLSGFLQGTGLSGSDLRNGYFYSRGLSLAEVHGTSALIGSCNFLLATFIRLFTDQIALPKLLPLLILLPFIIAGTLIGKYALIKIKKKYSDWIIVLVMIAILISLLYKIFMNIK